MCARRLLHAVLWRCHSEQWRTSFLAGRVYSSLSVQQHGYVLDGHEHVAVPRALIPRLRHVRLYDGGQHLVNRSVSNESYLMLTLPQFPDLPSPYLPTACALHIQASPLASSRAASILASLHPQASPASVHAHVPLIRDLVAPRNPDDAERRGLGRARDLDRGQQRIQASLALAQDPRWCLPGVVSPMQRLQHHHGQQVVGCISDPLHLHDVRFRFFSSRPRLWSCRDLF